jgi:hypothetical protein
MNSSHITTDIEYIAIVINFVNENSASLVALSKPSGSRAKIESFNPMRVLTLLLSVLSTVSLCRAQPGAITREYIIGGEPKVTNDREGDQFTNTVIWDGDSRAFGTIEKENDATLKTHESWTLSADGNTLTKKIHRTGGRGNDSDQTCVLEKN